MNLCWQLILSG